MPAAATQGCKARYCVAEPKQRSSIVLHDSQREVLLEHAQPFLEAAQSRFPLETMTYVQLVRAFFSLCPAENAAAQKLFDHISSLDEYTDVVNPDFYHYEQVDNDASEMDKDLLYLTQDLPVFLCKDKFQRSTSKTKEHKSDLFIYTFVRVDRAAVTRWHSFDINTCLEQLVDSPLAPRSSRSGSPSAASRGRSAS